MENKAVAIIQARLSSKRLPGKVLKYIDHNTTVLGSVINRVASATSVDQVIVATSEEPQDWEIVKFCEKNNVSLYRGSQDNVLARFFQCAIKFNATDIIRITSDNPLIDSAVIDEVFERYSLANADYAANNLLKSYPHGMDVEVISAAALKMAYQNANLKTDLEHVTQYIRHRPSIFQLVNHKYRCVCHNIRLTVDEAADLQLVRLVVRLLGKEPTVNQIVCLFDEFPELSKINVEVAQRHAEYNKNQHVI